MTSIPSNAVERNELLASATVDLRPSRSAFFHKKRSFYEWVSHGVADVRYKKYNVVVVALLSNWYKGFTYDFESRMAWKD